MAIIRSVAIGRARKSIGNVTMRTVRGRTIASEKVGPRPVTRSSAAQEQREAIFGLIARFARMHAASIGVSFNKTKYGSSRNYFFKVNYNALMAALDTLAGDVTEERTVTDEQIEEAVTAYATANPGQIVRIYRTGYDVVYLDGAWDSVPDPEYVAPVVTPKVTSGAFNGTDCQLKTSAPGMLTGNELTGGNLTLVGNNLSLVSKWDIATNETGTSWTTVTPSSGTDTQVVFAISKTVALYGVRLTYGTEIIVYYCGRFNYIANA